MSEDIRSVADAIEVIVKFRDTLKKAIPEGKDVERSLHCTLIINKTDALEVIDAITLLSGE